jgi:hypothetical protein
MADTKSEKKGLYYKVECREDALKLVNDTTNIWYIITVINVGFYAMLGAPGYFYVFPVLWVLMATGVRLLYSRVAAVILFLLSLYSAYVTLIMAAQSSSGGSSFSFIDVVITIVLIWASVRAIEATFLLTGQFAEPDQHG